MGIYTIEIIETGNKNKHCLLFHYLSQEGSTRDLLVLCSMSGQLHWLTAHYSLPCFLLISQEQPGRKGNTVSSNLVQAPCFPRDSVSRWVQRIGTEGTHRDSLRPMLHTCGHILIVQPSSDARRRSEACSISLA